jgi:hypothetical protein
MRMAVGKVDAEGSAVGSCSRNPWRVMRITTSYFWRAEACFVFPGEVEVILAKKCLLGAEILRKGCFIRGAGQTWLVFIVAQKDVIEG